MNKSSTSIEHHHKINNRMYNILAKRFFMIASEGEKAKDDIDFLTKISGSLGHLSHVSIGITKAFDQEKRIKEIEKRQQQLMTLNMTMFEEAPLEQYR